MRSYNNPAYFDSNHYCKAHGDPKCDDCQDLASSPTITAIAIRGDDSREAEDVKTNFAKQAEFIQVALDMDDEKLDKIKVKDMAALTQRGQQEITVGKMKKWLKIDKKKNLGVIGSLFKQIKWSFMDKGLSGQHIITGFLIGMIILTLVALITKAPR